jgi:serine protease
VVEFYDSAVNHYFLTASAAEAAYIDAGGAGPGWARTGFGFLAWSLGNAAPGTLPVCRFTGTPNFGPNSHFFTAYANECALVQENPYWLYEGVVFRTLVPSTGVCTEGTSPVVRFYWPGADVTLARHRYVVDPTEIAHMRASGWIEEGPVFCAP